MENLWSDSQVISPPIEALENLVLDGKNQEKLLWDVEEIPPFDDKVWVSLLNRGRLYDVVGGELSEVFSVQINSNSFAQGKTCEVYGDIDIVDKQGFSYEIYYRDISEAETISLQHNSLCLSPPDDFFVSRDWDGIKISINDRVDDSVIIDTFLKFGRDGDSCQVTGSDSDYDNVKSFTVNGVGGSAFVRYSRFVAGVLAHVDVTLTRNDTGITSDVYGTVTARLGNTYGKKFPGILLQKLSNSQMLSPTPGNPMDLSRELVAVPAYSFLRIEVDLFDSHTGEQFINGKADFPSDFKGMECKDIQSEDVCICVDVYWHHPDEVEKPFLDTKTSNPNDQTVGASILRRELSDHTYFGLQLVEVFAVMIGHDRNDVVKMCGRVKVVDSNLKTHTMFRRNESSPETLFSNLEIIPLRHPSNCYSGPEGLNIVLRLWEVEGEGEFRVNADIGWSLPSLMSSTWYDRRLCSVSQGFYGYAAVFYTMFSNAAQALINVSLEPLDFYDGQHKVYGSIVARYSNVDYPTEYERTLYQSVLFKKTQENALELTIWDTYSLVESAVAVPLVASLIVEVDLYISSNNYPEENLNKVIGFDIELGAPICSQIEGVNCRVGLSVQWSGVRKKISQ